MTFEPKEANLIKHIDVSGAGAFCHVRMGDLSGDGRLDFVMIEPDVSYDDRYFPHMIKSATAYSIDGEVLWQIGKPSFEKIECSGDLPAQIYDIDRDGNNEFLCVFKGAFCIFDGKTAELKKRFSLPDEYAYDSIAIADLEGVGYPRNIILKNRYHQLWAMDQNFNVLWSYKGNVGHYPVVCDINGDGRDEIIAGKTVLDAEGNVLWEFEGTDFPKCIFVGDLNMSCEKLIAAGGENTCIYSPEGNQLWSMKTNANIKNISFANIRPDSFGMEILGFFEELCDSEYTDGIFLTDYHGNTLFKEKRTNYIKNSKIEPIYNFDGSKTEQILVSEREGSPICIYDGYMNPLYIINKDGSAYWADMFGDGIAQILVYSSDGVDIYSAFDEADLSKFCSDSARNQTKELYNVTIYPYRVIESSRYALGYAIGQFANPDIEHWAVRCATDENEKTITRADFCVIITSLLGIKAYSTEGFFDVYKDDYFYPAINALKGMGYIDDIVGKFSPDSPLSAEFAIDIVKKAGGFVPLTTKSGSDELLSRDAAKIVLQIIQNINEKQI